MFGFLEANNSLQYLVNTTVHSSDSLNRNKSQYYLKYRADNRIRGRQGLPGGYEEVTNALLSIDHSFSSEIFLFSRPN